MDYFVFFKFSPYCQIPFLNLLTYIYLYVCLYMYIYMYMNTYMYMITHSIHIYPFFPFLSLCLSFLPFFYLPFLLLSISLKWIISICCTVLSVPLFFLSFFLSYIYFLFISDSSCFLFLLGWWKCLTFEHVFICYSIIIIDDIVLS